VDGCRSPDDDIEQDIPTGPCTDGYDNDLDGLTDADDPGCKVSDGLNETGKKKLPG